MHAKLTLAVTHALMLVVGCLLLVPLPVALAWQSNLPAQQQHGPATNPSANPPKTQPPNQPQ